MNQKQILTYAAIGIGAYLVIRYAGAKTVEAINPADPNNVVNRAASGFVERISNGKYLSVGDWLYSITHPNEDKLLNPPNVEG